MHQPWWAGALHGSATAMRRLRSCLAMRATASCSAGSGAAAQHMRKKPGSGARQSLPAVGRGGVTTAAKFLAAASGGLHVQARHAARGRAEQPRLA